MKQTVTALENGLSVVVVEDHFAPVVSMNIWVNVGSADEKPAQAGLAHVHEHMLFKGTEKRAVGKIASEIEGAGGDINAFTSHDHTCYYVTMASRYFQTGLDVLADAIDNSTFNATELDREIKVILEELSRSRDIPHQKLFENLFAKSFIKHPYGRPIIGYEDVLKNLRRKDVLSFFRRHYRPSNMILVVVGDVDTKKALSFIKRKFARLKSPNYRRSIRTPEPPQKAMRVMAMYDQIGRAHV